MGVAAAGLGTAAQTATTFQADPMADGPVGSSGRFEETSLASDVSAGMAVASWAPRPHEAAPS